MIGLFCKRALSKRRYSAKETYNFIDPTNCSPPIRETDDVCDMRWLRLVGSLEIYITFAKGPYKRDCILQKRPLFLRSLLIIATPYEIKQLLWREVQKSDRQRLWYEVTDESLYIWVESRISLWQFPLKLLHPQNPPNRDTQISRYLTVQIQIEILISFEFVLKSLCFWIWWIWGG